MNRLEALYYRLKSVAAIKMKFVAPMPEQIVTTTMKSSSEYLQANVFYRLIIHLTNHMNPASLRKGRN